MMWCKTPGASRRANLGMHVLFATADFVCQLTYLPASPGPWFLMRVSNGNPIENVFLLALSGHGKKSGRESHPLSVKKYLVR